MAQPGDKYGFLFSPDGLFGHDNYPYLLPCLFSSIFSGLMLAIALFMLPESLPSKVASSSLQEIEMKPLPAGNTGIIHLYVKCMALIKNTIYYRV